MLDADLDGFTCKREAPLCPVCAAPFDGREAEELGVARAEECLARKVAERAVEWWKWKQEQQQQQQQQQQEKVVVALAVEQQQQEEEKVVALAAEGGEPSGGEPSGGEKAPGTTTRIGAATATPAASAASASAAAPPPPSAAPPSATQCDISDRKQPAPSSRSQPSETHSSRAEKTAVQAWVAMEADAKAERYTSRRQVLGEDALAELARQPAAEGCRACDLRVLIMDGVS